MKYDVALSFAGEDREYVEQVANALSRKGVRYFYDKHEQTALWGKDLYEHLSDIYQKQARFTVMFISHHYAAKLWTKHERQNAQARAFKESAEYVLPARFDNTEIPGLRDTIGYINLQKMAPSELAEKICEKLVQAGVAMKKDEGKSSGEYGSPAFSQKVAIAVNDESGNAVSQADVFLVSGNGTYLSGLTKSDGLAAFDVAKRRLFTIFCAHPKYPAFLGKEFDPVRNFNIRLPKIENVGSTIWIRGWETIPGISGEIDPIKDNHDRLYIYTKNISVNGQDKQPTPFELNRELHLEDVDGNERFVRVIEAIGRCFLVEYRK